MRRCPGGARRRRVRIDHRAARLRRSRRPPDRHRRRQGADRVRRRADRFAGVQSGWAGSVGHRLPADGGAGHARRDLATVRPRVVRPAWRRCEHSRRVRQRLRRRHHAARARATMPVGTPSSPRPRGRPRRAPPTRSRSGRGSERTTRHAISTRSATRSATID